MRELMLEYGFSIDPVADGKIHRFKGPDDKRPNGWYVFHGDHGAFGHWKTGLSVKWSERGKLSPDERRALLRKIQASNRKRAREEKARHEKAARQAEAEWKKALPCIAHTYLSRKGVLSHGLKVLGDLGRWAQGVEREQRERPRLVLMLLAIVALVTIVTALLL